MKKAKTKQVAEEVKFEKYSKENLQSYKEFLSYVEEDLIRDTYRKKHSLIISITLYIFCLYFLFVGFSYYYSIFFFIAASILIFLYNKYSISFIILTVCCEFSKQDIEDIERNLKIKELGF